MVWFARAVELKQKKFGSQFKKGRGSHFEYTKVLTSMHPLQVARRKLRELSVYFDWFPLGSIV